jgi:hypothetical protein
LGCARVPSEYVPEHIVLQIREVMHVSIANALRSMQLERFRSYGDATG